MSRATRHFSTSVVQNASFSIVYSLPLGINLGLVLVARRIGVMCGPEKRATELRSHLGFFCASWALQVYAPFPFFQEFKHFLMIEVWKLRSLLSSCHTGAVKNIPLAMNSNPFGSLCQSRTSQLWHQVSCPVSTSQNKAMDLMQKLPANQLVEGLHS